MSRSRWSLATVAFVAGALVAEALVVPGGAGASQGQPIIAGTTNSSTQVTSLDNSQVGGTGMIIEGDESGVQGWAGADGGTGVYGLDQFDTGIGVEGAVVGSGSGVYGHAVGAGVGVNGSSEFGVGVLAQTGTGTALRVLGKATFSRSGVITVAAAASSRTVRLAGVTATSMVLATAQQTANVAVQAAVPSAAKFSIRLTGPAPTGGLEVAYFVLN